MRVVAGKRGKGRPKTYHPEFLCKRVSSSHHIFTWGMDKTDWEQMHRPLVKPYDPDEAEKRRAEYADLLRKLPYSELVDRCDPNDAKGYPERILRWQYRQGLLVPNTATAKEKGSQLLTSKARLLITTQQSEWAWRLAFFLVADEAGINPEYLRKIYRKWEPPSDTGPPFSIPVERK